MTALEKRPAVIDELFDPLPEGVPEVLPDTLPRAYETERLLIKETEKDLRFEDWFPECPSLWYDVYTKKRWSLYSRLGDLL